MLNTPRKVFNSSPCFTFPGTAVRWGRAGCLGEDFFCSRRPAPGTAAPALRRKLPGKVGSNI